MTISLEISLELSEVVFHGWLTPILVSVPWIEVDLDITVDLGIFTIV